jgi:hypothetical protein
VGDQTFETGEEDGDGEQRTIFNLYNTGYITESDEEHVLYLGDVLAVGIQRNMYPKRWKFRKEEWTATFTGSGKQRFLIRADVLERYTQGAPPHLVSLEVTPLASSAEIEAKTRLRHKLSTKRGGKQWRNAKQSRLRGSRFKTTTRRC